jgi:uncharacterized protein with PQ loop repeat
MVELAAQVLPVVAMALAIPQFAPQFVRLWRLRDPTGVSWTGLALTCVNNCAWLAYFVASGYTTALPTAGAAALGSGATACLLARLRRTPRRDVSRIAGWAVALAGLALTADAAFLGTALTVAAAGQLLPSVWSAYRTERPTGISIGTWLLVSGELACWGTYGLYQSDPRLVALGAMGTVAGSLVVGRAIWAGRSDLGRPCAGTVT